MDNKLKDNWLLIAVCLIMIVFVITFIFSEVAVEDVENPDNRYDYTFQEALERQLTNGTTDLRFQDGYLNRASESDIRQAMSIDERHIFEFLHLNEKVNLTEDEVNQLLQGRGILEGQGAAFLDAQEKYDINLIYLISHAQVETGNGSSELAEGISPGGSGETYYNFFGIGAFDSQAVEAGSSHAVEQNWDSPESAISGGAEFISESYVNNSQRTLYEIRWNPNNPGVHQYATDIAWSESIAGIMERYYHDANLETPEIERVYYQGADSGE